MEVAGLIQEGEMGTNFKPRVLICDSCNEEFVFTIEAQEYFAQRGYLDDPRMCKHCYTKGKREKRAQNGNGKSSGAIAETVSHNRRK